MKKFIVILISLFLFISISNISTSSLATINSKNLYKEGIYTVNENEGILKPGNYKVELVTTDTIAYVLLFDKEVRLLFNKRFDSAEPYRGLSSTIWLSEGDSILILGNGQISFNPI